MKGTNLRTSILSVVLLVQTCFVYAGNADVSGNWDISADSSGTFYKEEIFRESGFPETRYVNNGTFSHEDYPFSGFSAVQVANGVVSARREGPQGKISILTGTVSGYSITFKTVNTYERNYSIPSQYVYNGRYLYTSTYEFTGTVDKHFGNIYAPRKIRGTLTGTYHSEDSHELREPHKPPFYSRYLLDKIVNSGSFGVLLPELKQIKTTIISVKVEDIVERSATISWSGSGGDGGGVVGYNYRLDSGPSVYTTSTSINLENLDYGWHTFFVQGVDAMGNTEIGFATESFYIRKITPRPNPPQEADLGRPRDNQKTVGDPINSVTGNMHITTTDFSIPAGPLTLEFIRTYNSQSNEISALGYGWTHNYNLSLTQDALTKEVKIKDGDGKIYLFAYDSENRKYLPQRGENSTLEDFFGVQFTWKKKDGRRYVFDATGNLSSISDRNDNMAVFLYNPQNLLERILVLTNPLIMATFTYDVQRRLIRLVFSEFSGLGSKRNFDYSYDAGGNLAKVKDPKGNITSYDYDINHNLIQQTDHRGNSVYFAYDSSDRCISSKGENNAGKVELFFDPANKKTTLTDSKGNRNEQYYNQDLMIARVINPQGKEIRSAWDNNLNLVSRTDENGNTTALEYDAQGNLIRLTDAEGKTTLFTYEPNFNLLKTVTDPAGNTTTYSYDTKGNLLEAKDALGKTTTYTYNEFGQVSKVTSPLGKSTEFSYDASGNPESIKDALANITSFKYDGLGNLIENKDSQGKLTKYAYDELNQLIKITYADNSVTTFAYDAAGNRISLTDNVSRLTSYAYDPANRLKSVTDPAGNKVTYAYDTEGNLTSITDPLGQKTSYEYDSLNRLTTLSDARSNKKQYAYDSVGNLILLTDANGQRISYEYDSLNRLTKIIYPDSQVSFGYDLLGRRSSLSDASGLALYTYDSLGRLTKVDGPKANDNLEYTYDETGQRLMLTDPEGRITRYSYDALGRLSSITDPQGKVVNYGYDASGNLTSLVYPNGIRTIYSYDSLNRLLKLTQSGITDPNQKLAEFSYTYDPSGRKSKVSSLEGSIDYGYDAAGRLTSENANLSGNSSQISYGYDAAGNRLTKIVGALRFDYCYNELNQLTEENISSSVPRAIKIPVKGQIANAAQVKSVKVNGHNASFDGARFSCFGITLNEGRNTIIVQALDSLDRVIATKSISVTYSPAKRISYIYDNNGNLRKRQSELKSAEFSYDFENRLTEITSAGKEVGYQYDGEGKRIALTEGTATTNYLYDGLNVLAERNSSGQTTASYTRNPFAAGGIGGLISGQGLFPEGSVPATYYLFDGLGNVSGLSDASGAAIQSYSYDAFGNIVSQSGLSNNPYQFSSKSLDPSGLVYFGARYYDPRIGRWITSDPSGMVDGPNLYQYCLNDPVNWVDPWGLCKQKKDVPWWVWGGLIGATIEPTPYGEVIAYPIATKYLIEAGIITAAVYQATRKHPLWRELTEITQVPKTYPYISTDPSKDPRFDPGKGWRRTMWWVLQIMRIWKNIAGSGQ